MKNLRYIFAAAFALLAMACSRYEENLFPESAAQRMNDAVEKYTKVLESAENGWKVQFYAYHDNLMGGYVYTFRFKEGIAYIRAEVAADPTEEYASLYQVKGEQECLLTFDSYTEALHLFSEPSSSSTTGMESDYEFCFKSLSADENEIVLKGKRYGQPLVLTRIANEEDPEEYMEKIVVMSDYLNNMMPRMLAVVDGEDEYEVMLAGGVFTYSIPHVKVVDEKEVVSYEDFSYPYITTVEGLHFKDEVEFYGKKFQDCTYDPEEDCLTAVGADVYFPFTIPPGFREYEELVGSYTVTTDEGERPITVTANADGETYTITGMSYFSPTAAITAQYNSTFGSFEIHPQYMARYSSYYLWIFVSTPDGYVTWDTSESIIGINDEAGNVSFKGNANSIMEYACTAQTPSSTTIAGWVTDYGEVVKFTRVE